MDYRNNFSTLNISNRIYRTDHLEPNIWNPKEQAPCHGDQHPGGTRLRRSSRFACRRLSQMAGFAAKIAHAGIAGTFLDTARGAATDRTMAGNVPLIEAETR